MVDDITSTNGVGFTVNATNPTAAIGQEGGATRVVFNDIGPIPPRETRVVQVQFTVDAGSRSGRIMDTVGLSFALALAGVEVLRRRSRNHASPDLNPSYRQEPAPPGAGSATSPPCRCTYHPPSLLW